MSMWWVARTAGAITTACGVPTPECQEGPLDDATTPDLRTFLQLLSTIPFSTFIARWTDPEYALLMQRRATAIGAGNVTLVKQWDFAASAGSVNLNSAAAQNFKTAIVAAGILTQARADIIFS